MTKKTPCTYCGMDTTYFEYHPYAACVLFKRTKSPEQVRSFLRHIITYGMEAERQGIKAGEAQKDARKIRAVVLSRDDRQGEK